jgi:NAD(P)-dependent dehydrogenase (short-subunit alcohol dehydrogenase family)
VAVMDDCVAASAAVSAAFPKKMVSFLFNNAGIQGPGRAGGIIADPSPETMAAWQAIFNVNVFGGRCYLGHSRAV